ncbi:MAG TPA: glycine oxidase ThiO [Candidatus Kryptonia bacterium]|nr:glycine oxidase ThiO [Candidatus Kryptonia bacterium]
MGKRPLISARHAPGATARQPDVLIIGGGVIGCSVAYYLTRDSALRVVVLERGTLGCGASNAAAGVLAVGSSRAPRGVLFELRRRSAAMFPDLVAALRDQTAIDPQYVPRGLLELAFTQREESELRQLVERRCAQGFRAELLDAVAARRIEPYVAPQIRVAALFHDDHTINNEKLTAAFADAASRHGTEFRLGTAAAGVERAHQRIHRVHTSDGEWLSPGVVVLAAGPWSPEFAALLRVRVPVRPARGEMLAMQPQPGVPQRTVAWGDGYLVPRPNGELLVGSTTAYADAATVTSAGIATLRERAIRMMPALAAAEIVRTWAGLRPCSTIRRPIIGPVRGFDNFLLATGHHRNGILLAPITGQLIAELITERATSVPLEPFGYRPR